MAASLVKQASNDLLKCAICTRHFISPKMLQCLHNFCEQCLTDSLSRSGITNGQAFLCPICKEECVVPFNGVAGMKTNVYLETLHEFTERKTQPVKQQSCEGCEGRVAHAVKKCIECDDWLCEECCSMHRKVKVTRGHHLVGKDDLDGGNFDELIKDNFETLICARHGEPLKLFCTERTCLGPICTVCKTTSGHDGHIAVELSTRANEDMNKIQNLLANVQDSINAGCDKVNNIKHADKAASAARKKMHKDINARMTEVCEMVVKEIGDYAETLHDQVEKMVKSHRERLAGDLDDGKNALKGNVGAQVLAQSLLDFRRPEEVVAIATDVIERLELYQRPPRTLAPVWRQPRLNPPDKITTSQIAQLFGSLTFEGELVKTTLVRVFSAKAGNDEREPSLSDIAISLDNEIVVADKDNRRIKTYDHEGQLMMATPTSELRLPNRVAVMKQTGKLLVKDENFLKLVQTDGSVIGNFLDTLQQPVGVDVNPEGSIVITDWSTFNVHIFDSHGQQIHAFPNNCEAPAYVATDKAGSGNIIVSDWKKHKVIVYDPTGKFLFDYGEPGRGQYQLDHPYGVCTDMYGHIFIADTWNNRIHMLNPDGKFMKYLVTKDDGLQWPQAIATDDEGFLVVAEQHGTVKVYQYVA